MRNDGYPASLEPNRLYAVLPDESVEDLGMIRVIDESGDGYLYPVDRFAILPRGRGGAS